MTAKVRTCLWFDGNGEEAAKAYVALLPDSRIEKTFSPRAGAPPLVIDFTLGGTPYQILNGGPGHPHSWAASISVSTGDQAETDRLWAALLADGGVESRCGWLKDRFGLSWQIVPEALPRLLADPDPEVSARVMQAMMQMIKIDVAAIEAAAAAR
jgi:predicted 3-demethylubiquinone-9 3-methyltransferase (glyoxalase superfamily)